MLTSFIAQTSKTQSEQPSVKAASRAEILETTSTGNEMTEHELIIDGASCVNKIEKALLSVSGGFGCTNRPTWLCNMERLK